MADHMLNAGWIVASSLLGGVTVFAMTFLHQMRRELKGHGRGMR